LACGRGSGVVELDVGITWVILESMKTAISLPDPIFKAADRLARRLGVSRSELYAKAVSEYLERYRQEGITAALNRVYGSNPEESQVEADVLALQEASVPRERW
jgi:metal-responsive CopG/Arc/MetJ family transcriptional regulator